VEENLYKDLSFTCICNASFLPSFLSVCVGPGQAFNPGFFSVDKEIGPKAVMRMANKAIERPLVP